MANDRVTKPLDELYVDAANTVQTDIRVRERRVAKVTLAKAIDPAFKLTTEDAADRVILAYVVEQLTAEPEPEPEPEPEE